MTADAAPNGPDPDELRASVLSALRVELDLRRRDVLAVDPRLGPEVDRLVAFVTDGGKVLRGTLLCLGHLAVAADLPDAVVRAAAAVELLQACALLHDDLIDRSDTRRGRPSVHRAVAAAHPDVADPDHLGVSIALLLGDLALAWADDLFVEAARSLGRLDDALPDWRAVRAEVLSGQLLDVLVTALPAADANGQLADAEQVNLFKTAAYTVTRPLLLGAALAGATAATRGALTDYGRDVGLAFQLRDDLLGVFGDPVVTGKPVAGDLVEGKRTVLIARTRQALADRPAALATLDDALGVPELAPDLTALILESGAPARVEVDIDAHLGAALSALHRRDESGRAAVRADTVATLAALARQSAYRER